MEVNELISDVTLQITLAHNTFKILPRELFDLFGSGFFASVSTWN